MIKPTPNRGQDEECEATLAEPEENLTEKTVSSQLVFAGKVVRVRTDRVILPDGREATREIVEHPGGVAVVPLLPPDAVVLVRQYRPAVGETLWEIPAGKLEDGEAPELCAQRELAEETGFRVKAVGGGGAGSLKLLASFYSSPGFSQEKLWLYVAKGLEAGQCQPDDGEFLRVEVIPGPRLARMLEAGEIVDGKTILGLSLTRWWWDRKK